MAMSADHQSRSLITARDHAELARIVALLERPSFAIKVADVVGRPFTHAMGMLPKVTNRPMTRVLEAAIVKCLKVAIDSLDGTPALPPSRWLPRLTTGVTGGVGGFFGALALPVELPLTTMLMLQSIADIARHHGEDLKRIEARLACLEVFALGDRRSGKRADIGYYATRSALVQLTTSVAALAVQRQTVDTASPVVTRMVGEIAGRFGFALSERAAAAAVPIAGGVSAAVINVLFMSHFQQIAEGHFTVRRLERHYGAAPVQSLYRSIASGRGAGRGGG
jgi:hypothetical protein